MTGWDRVRSEVSRAQDLADRLERERSFHEELAAEFDAQAMPRTPLSELDAAMVVEVDIRPGMRVLDLGCGSGDLTLHLVNTGADVVALDLAPSMVEVARERVARFGEGGTARFVAAPAEDSGLPAGHFDLILGRYVLHHLDLDAAASEIARLLRPGGRAVFVENWGGNSVLMFARRHLVGRFGIRRLGTADEHPLSREDVERMAAAFSTVDLRFPVFEFFVIFDRQLLRFRWQNVSRLLQAADRWLGRVAFLAPYSFRVVVVLTR
jgi:SAM-dependent methyltransferase